MKLQPDDDTIAQFCTGDRKAFGIIYSFYYKYVYVIAYAILPDEHMARDIASEVFLKLWGQRKKFSRTGEVKGWLIISCRNASLNELRFRQRRQAAEKELISLTPAKAMSQEHQLIELEVVCELLRQLESLPPRCREVVQLMFFQGKRTAEVAVQLGISPITVQTHKTNALLKLRAFRSIHKF
jgi:RNA polymerase sigma-70 factor (family 1)